jgi:hypothetical protein
MTDKPASRLAIPKIRRDMSNLSELLREAIPTAERSDTPEVTPPARTPDQPLPVALRNQSVLPGNQSDRIDSAAQTNRGRPVNRINALASDKTLTVMRNWLDNDVVIATKIRALEEKTTDAAIVEAALRSYLKLASMAMYRLSSPPLFLPAETPPAKRIKH